MSASQWGGLFSFPPKPTTSVMDTLSAPSTNIQQQPQGSFMFGVPALGNATAAAAGNTPMPQFNWGNNNTSFTSPATNTTPIFGNTNMTNAASPNPANAIPSFSPSPFSFQQPKIPKPSFTFNPQGQGQNQFGLWNNGNTTTIQPQTQLLQNAIPQPQANINQFLLQKISQLEMILGQNVHVFQPGSNILETAAAHPNYDMALQFLRLYPEGRPSSLAMECLQMAANDRSKAFQSSGFQTFPRNRGSFIREPPFDNYPLERKHACTCLSYPRSTERRSYNDDVAPMMFRNRNDIRFKTFGVNEGDRCENIMYEPPKPVFKYKSYSDSLANFRATRFLSCLPENKAGIFAEDEHLRSERDLRWKVLNTKVVTEREGKREVSKRNDETCLWELPEDVSPNKRRMYCSTCARNREPQTMWNCFNTALSTGPPLKSHLDDEDYRLYELLKQASSSNKKPETVANLPGRLDSKEHPAKLHKIIKPRASPSSHMDMKKDIQILFRRIQSKESRSIPLEEKSSPVFLTKKSFFPKRDPVPVSLPSRRISSSSQTDATLDDDDELYYSPRFNGRKYNNNLLEDDEVEDILGKESEEEIAPQRLTCGVKLTREGYYCVPDLATLDSMINQRTGECFVHNFVVGHHDHGKVMFPGYTDVSGLDLDKIVRFTNMALSLYPEDEETPGFGKGLNRPCQVTLYNVWPMEKMENVKKGAPGLITDPQTVIDMGFDEYLRDRCLRFGAKFLNYYPEDGIWTFMIQMQHSSEAP